MAPRLSYGVAGSTSPALATWVTSPPGYRRFEQTVLIGRGQSEWEAAAGAVMAWEVKTRSGFSVWPTSAAQLGADYRITARWGPFAVHEPVRVVAVVDEPTRCGFAYGTLEGHPVSGEEAFVVHRDPAYDVWLTLRSLTRPGRGAWRVAFPGLLLAQRVYRSRYRRALVGPAR